MSCWRVWRAGGSGMTAKEIVERAWRTFREQVPNYNEVWTPQEVQERLHKVMDKYFAAQVAKATAVAAQAVTNVGAPANYGRIAGAWKEDLDHAMCTQCARVYGPEGDGQEGSKATCGVRPDGTVQGLHCPSCYAVRGIVHLVHPWKETSSGRWVSAWWHPTRAAVRPGWGTNSFTKVPPTSWPHEWQQGVSAPAAVPSPLAYNPFAPVATPAPVATTHVVKLRSGSYKGRCGVEFKLATPVEGVRVAPCSRRAGHAADYHESRHGHMDDGRVLARWEVEVVP